MKTTVWSAIKSSGLIVLISLISFHSLAQSTQKSVQGKAKKILILYLSRTGNTKALAEIIQEMVGGKMIALELEKPYPTDYKQIVSQVHTENEQNILPKLKTRIANIREFDLIFLGTPTWSGQLPPPYKSFLKSHDLSGKTIIPFNTNAGYGLGSTFTTISKLAPNSRVLPGYTTKGGIERDGVMLVIKGEKEKQVNVEIHSWLRKLKLL